MGIRLDWEIEAEQERVPFTGEDPESKRRRRRARLRAVGFVLLVLLLLGSAVGAVYLRLRTVEWQIEQLLRDTVDAEVAALRLGDRTAFLNIQRSATDDWLREQGAFFQQIQDLKLTQDVRLTGRVLDIAVDGQRGRVRVEEIINGVPYARTWFYWRYEDGWRHVPPDYLFWGEVRTQADERLAVRYRAYDADIAAVLFSTVSEWLALGCEALTCDGAAALKVEILPDPALQIGWSPTDPTLLLYPSPFVGVARVDQLFDAQARMAAASLIAERMVLQAMNGLQPLYPADAYYLRQAIVSWLVGRFTRTQTNSFLVESLAANYGPDAVGRLARALVPSSSVSVVSAAVGAASLAQMPLDWRDFLTWRLRLEDDLYATRDEAAYLALYDLTDPAVETLARARFAATTTFPMRTVVSVALGMDERGAPVLRALAQRDDGGQDEVMFRLVENDWKRAQ